MPTLLVGFCDPHWTTKRPRSRRDVDWMGTQRRKLRDILTIAKKINVEGQVGAAAIQIAGDLFHEPDGRRISRELDTMLLKELQETSCPIVTIPGNHDMEAERLESLSKHPYGVLTAAGVIQDVCWPHYLLVGEDPLVICTGYPYVPEGPASWLTMLATSKELIRLKTKLSEELGKTVYASIMTHNHYGETQGPDEKHIYRTGKSLLFGTGIDCCLYGDPHTYDGIQWLENGQDRIALCGPGSTMRYSLAEHDTTREPAVMVAKFFLDRFEVETVAIPHQPAEQVFNIEQHKREVKRREVQSQFMQSMQSLVVSDKSIPEMLELAGTRGARPTVLNLVDRYLRQVEDTEQ